MKGKRVLLIDDDLLVLDIAGRAYQDEQAEIFTAKSSKEALRLFYACQPDLVILDIMMPEIDGWEICRQIRLLSDVPIIMLTSLDREEDIVRGLESGADDFISKPFSPKVLLSRSRAVLRRLSSSPAAARSDGYADEYLQINLDHRKVLVNGESIKLTPTEYKLMAYLVSNAGRVLSFEQILENVWGWEYRDSIDYVHVYISHLRRKIEVDSKNPEYILSEHGWGYRFEKKA